MSAQRDTFGLVWFELKLKTSAFFKMCKPFVLYLFGLKSEWHAQVRAIVGYVLARSWEAQNYDIPTWALRNAREITHTLQLSAKPRGGLVSL